MSQSEMFKILVVDDDVVCLSLLKAHLEKWHIYEVTTAKHAKEALDMLRTRTYDLVISDVHMPDMDGVQLLRQIDQEFHLPVILISADSGEVIRGIRNGAQSFLVKPIEADDMKQIWQYAVWWKKTKKNVASITTEINESFEGDVQMADHHNGDDNNIIDEDVLSSDELSPDTESPPGDDTKGGRNEKLIWKSQLHSRFAEAILVIGYHEAFPSKILEVMNVPGITKKHVSSHLQRYRQFLLDVLDGKKNLNYNNWVDTNYHSSIFSGNPDLLLLNQLREEKNGRSAAVPAPEQHNINVTVRAPSRSSNLYRPLPPYTGPVPFSSKNATLNGPGNATIPNAYNENIGSSSTPSGNNVAPSSGTAQPSLNVGGQGSSNAYNENNFNTNLVNQIENNHGDPSIDILVDPNQTGNTSVMNAQQPDTRKMLADLEIWLNRFD